MRNALQRMGWALLMLVAAVQLRAQTTGDIAFTGFNADGTDGFAFVTFVDIPANTQIWFTDEEWNGTAFATAASEGDLVWSNSAITPAGTVVYIFAASTATPGASEGTAGLGAAPGSTSGPNLGASAEGLYAYLGAQRAPTTFLAAIANNTWGGGAGLLTGTGLTAGANAVELLNDVDVAAYTGSRNNQTTFSGYKPLIHNVANWISNDGAGDQSIDGVAPDVPFDTTSFTLSASDLTPPTPTTALFLNDTTVRVTFSEAVTSATATLAANYSFSPALGITSATLSASGDTATLRTAEAAQGVFYTFSVASIADLAGNVMPVADSFVLVINNTTPSLVFSEIMYDEPSSADTLDFVEVYNNGLDTAVLGGMRITNGISFTFPQAKLAPGAAVVIGQDSGAAHGFYGVPFYQYQGAISNGGETFDLRNTDDLVLTSVTYDDAAPWPLGPPDPNGGGPSIELINPSVDENVPSNWKISGTVVGPSNTGTVVLASPGVVSLPTQASLSFVGNRVTVSETAASVQFRVTISALSATPATVQVVLSSYGTASNGADFTFTPDTLSFSTASNDTLTITIPVTNDMMAENDEYFAIELRNPVNAEINGSTFAIANIQDNDRLAPVATEQVQLNLLASYSNGGSGSNSAEIAAYDSATKRIFIANSVANRLDIVNLANPAAPAAVTSVDLAPYGEINSVAVDNSIVAIAVGDTNAQRPGRVVFFDTNGGFLKQVTVGALPDMITFTPDGSKVLTANEGEPSQDYLDDPEGSVSIIDISGGIANLTQANVSTATFTAFNGQEAALRAQGIRIFGPNATAAKDFEPEYIAVSDNSQTAWVTLQENNALAIVNIATATVTNVLPLGFKDHSLPGNGLDGSNTGGDILIANYPVKGIYMPDAIASYTIGGQTYLITANEGDLREYDAFEEERSIGSGTYVLDPTAFPNGAQLKAAIGPLKTTSTLGDTDSDGDYDEIYVIGGRSYTIWNAATGAKVYDSGDQLELITAQHPVFSAIFNASNTNITRKNRSDDKGPEPEGVAVGTISTSIYAFVALERIGGVMVYDVTNPTAPVFVQYVNNRSTTAATGDLGAEGIIFIKPGDSPNGQPLVIVANEISSTLTIYQVSGQGVGIEEVAALPLRVYPNPVREFLHIEAETAASSARIQLYTMDGRLLLSETTGLSHDLYVGDLASGLYLLKVSAGGQTAVSRVVVE